MEKRKPRSYKIADKPYNKAKKRAKGNLATKIEDWVTQYGNGFDISIIYFGAGQSNKQSKKSK